MLAFCCALAFLQDALLPGRTLVPYPPTQFDVTRAEAMAAGTFDAAASRRGNTSGGDKYLQSLCWDRVLHDRLRQGDVPLWTRDIVGGAPFVPQMAQVYEPVNLLLLMLPSAEWYGVWYLLHQVLFGYLCYTFLRRLGCLHASALLGLVAAVLGLWTQCKVHHNVILTAALPLWPMLSAVWDLAHARLDARARRRTIAAFAGWTGISWLSGFAVVSLQVTYVTVAFAAIALVRVARGERLRFLFAVGTALGLGALLSCAHMIPVLQASAISARDSSWNPTFLAAHGLEWDHALTALWPDLLCWPQDAFYANPHDAFADWVRIPLSQLVLLHPLSPVTGGPFQSWVETSFAVGLLPTACAVTALLDRNRRAIAWGFAGLGVLAFGFATADEPLLSLARFVPGIASADLRRTLFTVAMALVVLAALGADAVLRGERRWPAVAVLGTAALGSITCLCWLWLSGSGDGFARAIAELYAADTADPVVQGVHGELAPILEFIRGNAADGEIAHNFDALAATGWRTLAVALVGAALLFRGGRLRPALLLAVTAIELLVTGHGFVQTVPAIDVTTPPKVTAPMFAAAEPNGVRPRLGHLAARTEGRVASWYPGNLPGFHGLEDATGYNPLPAARFEQFFTAIEPDVTAADQARGAAAKANVAFGGAGVGAFRDPASLQHPLCDLFGIRFVVTRLTLPTTTTLVDRTPPGTGAYHLYERTTTLPRATFVRYADIVPDPRQRLQVLGQRDRDVAQRIVLEDPAARLPAAAPHAAPASVAIREHRDERVVVDVDTAAEGYLRLADPYDPGWRATVDGEPSAVLPADHYLRAVFVPAGRHEVVFTFDAPRVRWPLRVSLTALLAIAALAVAGRRRA